MFLFLCLSWWDLPSLTVQAINICEFDLVSVSCTVITAEPKLGEGEEAKGASQCCCTAYVLSRHVLREKKDKTCKANLTSAQITFYFLLGTQGFAFWQSCENVSIGQTKIQKFWQLNWLPWISSIFSASRSSYCLSEMIVKDLDMLEWSLCICCLHVTNCFMKPYTLRWTIGYCTLQSIADCFPLWCIFPSG